MSSESAKLDICFKKSKRQESKKRKAQAFLDLVSNEEPIVLPKSPKTQSAIKSAISTICRDDPDAASLLNNRKKLQEMYSPSYPTFALTHHGIDAKICLRSLNTQTVPVKTSPLFIEDIHCLLLKALLCSSPECQTRWCRVLQNDKLKNVLCFVVDGLSKNTLVENESLFPNSLMIFPDVVEVFNSQLLNFASELSNVQFSSTNKKYKDQHQCVGGCYSRKPLSTFFPIENDFKNSEGKNTYTKINLLLSPIQLVMENYPLPKNVFNGTKAKGYCCTKDVYAHVTPDSPLFALDCEMALSKGNVMEVTRVALVNENFEVVYETLVKPERKILNYLTRYSGVTEEMLANVDTTLADVQNKIKSLLPPDAILCGQSLNCDLHALKMIHPYVIDTSVIYNTSGCRVRKIALKALSEKFLNEAIQGDKTGHNPIEDCIATMKLVLLKLKKGLFYGDAVLLGKPPKISKAEAQANSDEIGIKDLDVNLNENNNNKDMNVSFFSKLKSLSKSICVVGNERTCNLYAKETGNIMCIVKSSVRKIVKHSMKSMTHHNLVISHVTLNSENLQGSISELDNGISELYKNCIEDSLFIIFAPGIESKEDENESDNGFCMIKLKHIKNKKKLKKKNVANQTKNSVVDGENSFTLLKEEDA